jgi:UDPglucose 6-dehydrogenase/GDP-mannose 6-dehydrogenase
MMTMRITVVGTGYVGLTAGVGFASLGHSIVCVDVQPSRADQINAGKVPFYDPDLPQRLAEALISGRIRATLELDRAVSESDVIFITVGTPQSERGINLTGVEKAAREIGAALRKFERYHLVVVKSTVVPGTTSGLIRQTLEEASGKRAGEFGLCMNPEFLREGSAMADFLDPDRIVVGEWDQKSGDVLAELYRPFHCPLIRTTTTNAEMIKYAANALLATLISFSNEIAAVCEATPEADVQTVMEGVHLDRRLTHIAANERIRPGILNFLLAGCGFGGSCLPKDVNALRAYAREHSVTPALLDAVMKINDTRPARLGEIAEGALGSLQGATVVVLGLAFKPGTDDLRDSPALSAVRVLQGKGAKVRVYDPQVTPHAARTALNGRAVVCESPQEALRDADAAVVVTPHSEFFKWKWEVLCRQMQRPIIIDGRNAMRSIAWPDGVRYIGIGRWHEGDQD